MRLASLAATLFFAVACDGGAPTGDRDAGRADAGPWSPPDISPPVEPAPAAEAVDPRPPSITCPAGWEAMVTDEPEPLAGEPDARLGYCAPFPGDVAATCADDEAHFPGTPGCTRIGSECGEWPPDLPTTGVVWYVRAGAPPGGDGSRERPYARIGEAAARAFSGHIIALAPGTYEELVRPERGVSIWGSCASGTRITHALDPAYDWTVTAPAGETTIRNLSIGGDQVSLGLAGPATILHLRDVIIAGGSGLGVVANTGSTLHAERVIVRDTVHREAWGDSSYAVSIDTGATATLRQVYFENNGGVALMVAGEGTTATVEDVYVRDPQPLPSTSIGYGIVAQNRAHLTLSRAVVEEAHETAVRVDDRATLIAADLVVRRTAYGVRWAVGHALGVFVGAHAEIRRARFEHNASDAITMSKWEDAHPSPTLLLEDVLIRLGASESRTADGAGGAGIGWASELTLRRVRLEHLRGSGISGWGGVRVDAEDLWIRDVRNSRTTVDDGQAIQLYESTLTGSRIRIDDAQNIALHLGLVRAEIDDLIVRRTRSRPDAISGEAIHVDNGSMLTLRRARLERNVACAICAWNTGTTVDAQDLIVRDTESEIASGYGGFGITGGAGITLRLSRALLERNHDSGILVLGYDGTDDPPPIEVDIQDIVVADTLPSSGRFESGRGIGLGGTVRARIQRARIERNAQEGLLVSGAGAELEATDLQIRDTVGEALVGFWGTGLTVAGGRARVERAVLERNREIGIGAFATGATLEATDVVVRETLPRDCATREPPDCPDEGVGCAAAAVGRGSLTLTRFLLERSALCGMILTPGSTVDLHHGEVRDNPIGANVQDAEFDLDRLLDRVRWHNERDFDGSFLPIPRPGEGPE